MTLDQQARAKGLDVQRYSFRSRRTGEFIRGWELWHLATLIKSGGTDPELEAAIEAYEPKVTA